MDRVPVKIEWGNIRHDEDLDRLLNPRKPIGADFARRAEAQIFRSMLAWKVWKIYVWDDFHSEGDNARWDWCFAPIKPEHKACREHNFANLVAMDDWHFERFVRSLPPSPNEDIVREWRKKMREDPLIVQAAKTETTPMDWSDLEYDPGLIKEKLL
jgi:hypothetical protein